jgi:sigma-B regulation protein RsbU (phosphoserine phosphatase)
MSAGISRQLASARLLVADDQPHILAALEILLHGEGYQTDRAVNPENVLQALQEQKFDVVLMDLNYTRDTTGGAEGLELVTRIRAIDQTIPLVVMTAWGNVDLAVEAMRRGASDFVQKPWSNHQLLEKVREQVERCRMLRSTLRRHEEESSEASAIQKSLLPSLIPQIPGYDIAATTQSMHFIGGDYYNIVPISEAQTAICIADVAGKGLPGALLMSNLQASLKPLIHKDIQPHDLCSRLNRTLCEIMPENKFISLFYGVLDSKNNWFTYCNAGHNPPILLSANGNAIELNSSGAILGRFPDWQYSQTDRRLSPGDALLLFTDGVIEACDQQNELFGEGKLVQVAQESVHQTAGQMQSRLLQAASEHCGGKFQDDATLIVLKSKANS